jgi:hypothetical protein
LYKIFIASKKAKDVLPNILLHIHVLEYFAAH